MRVLMLSRDDVHNVMGGDTIQMLQTMHELEKLGVRIQLGTSSHMPSLDQFDIVHIFNWEQLTPILVTLERDHPNRLPIVLSPIFWYHTGHWYNEAVLNKKVWNVLNYSIGVSRSRSLYEKWQQMKFRWEKRGRELRKSLKIPGQLLPNSMTEIEHLNTLLGLDRDLFGRVTVVPNGVARDLYDPLPAPNQEFLETYGIEGFVIEVARIQSAKNQLGLIEALFDIKIPVVLIGQPSPYEADYVDRCLSLAKQRGGVYFVNPRSPEELAGIYVLAEVHVLPSWRETPGLASLEAAAAGCRVVTTSIGSAKEYFGDEAWYCDPRDPSSIRQAVLAALESPPKDTLRRRVLEQYTWEAAAIKTYEAYRKVLS